MALTNGLVVMTPTSIASTGSGNSSSINADGSVDFSSCETLSLNGVFTSSYDNYMVVMRYTSSGAMTMYARLRLSGTDASGSNYTRQFIAADNTSITANRYSTTNAAVGGAFNTQRAGSTVYFYGPYLSQPTAMRSVVVGDSSSAHIEDYASTHSLSTSYDGFTYYPDGYTISGLVTVFGFAQ